MISMPSLAMHVSMESTQSTIDRISKLQGYDISYSLKSNIQPLTQDCNNINLITIESNTVGMQP